MRWYSLSSVKSYYLCQKLYLDSRDTVKCLFSNLFNIIDFEKVLVLNDKLIINETDLNKINSLFKYYIYEYNTWSKLHSISFSHSETKELESYDNNFVIAEYTKNFVKEQPFNLQDIVVKKNKLFKRHVDNLENLFNVDKVVSFDFEYNGTKVTDISEIGITVFYPKKDITEHFHYIINSNINKGRKRINLEKHFKFGKSEHVHILKAINILNKHILEADFIVGHDLINELNILDIAPDWDKIIDSKFCDVFINQRTTYFSLEGVLSYYGFKISYLHNAGNDAAMVMQLLEFMYKDNFSLNLDIKTG